MPKRKPSPRPTAGLPGKQGTPRAPATPPRVLVVGADPDAALGAVAVLRERLNAACVVMTPDEAQRCRDLAFDTAVIDLDESGGGLRAAEALASDEAAGACLRVVFTSAKPTLEAGVLAMRANGVDLVARPFAPAALAESVARAADQTRKLREGERRARRLKKACKRLQNARREVTQKVDGLCADLLTAYQELADQMEQVTIAGEFNSLIRQELDVESLLRTTLEYMLTKTGPTNAAVFLPTGPREYSLGAYVNYDIPRETADVLLDHLADTLPQAFESEQGVLLSESSEQLAAFVSGGAGWIAGSTVLVFTCRKQGECLGVAALFRSPSRPFTPDIVQQVTLMRDLFTQQLARVINVHNRHKPKDSWTAFGEEPDGDDDGGLAA